MTSFAKAKSPARPPTEKQVDFLFSIGCRRPSSFEEASNWITEYFHEYWVAYGRNKYSRAKNSGAKDNSIYLNDYNTNGEGMWGDYEHH